MENKKSPGSIFLSGVIRENPVLVLLLGACPTLAVTNMAKNGVGMGLSTLFVLLCSNIVIALIKNWIPSKARIPCYIVIIAGFVTILQLLLKAYLPSLDAALGMYLQLITVNCIILGRAEAFASKNTVRNSVFDALGMGTGFTLALFFISSIREILGNGTWFGLHVTKGLIEPMVIFMLPPGGFFVFGIVVAFVNLIIYNVNRHRRNKIQIRTSLGCEGCPSSAGCPNAGENGIGEGDEA